MAVVLTKIGVGAYEKNELSQKECLDVTACWCSSSCSCVRSFFLDEMMARFGLW